MRFFKKKCDQIRVATLMRDAEIDPKLATQDTNPLLLTAESQQQTRLIANFQEPRAEKHKGTLRQKIEGQHFNIQTVQSQNPATPSVVWPCSTGVPGNC